MELRSNNPTISYSYDILDELYKKPWIRFSDFCFSLENDLATLILSLRHPDPDPSKNTPPIILQKEQRIKTFYILKQYERIYYMSGFDSTLFLRNLVNKYLIILNITFKDPITRIKGKIDGLYWKNDSFYMLVFSTHSNVKRFQKSISSMIARVRLYYFNLWWKRNMKHHPPLSSNSFLYVDQSNHLHLISNHSLSIPQILLHLRLLRKTINLSPYIDLYNPLLDCRYYPNMKSICTYRKEMNKMRREIAEFHGDFRCLWYLTDRHRDVFHSRKIMNWKQCRSPLDFTCLSYISPLDQSILQQMCIVNNDTLTRNDDNVFIVKDDLFSRFPINDSSFINVFIDIEYDIHGTVYLIGLYSNLTDYIAFWSFDPDTEKQMWLNLLVTLKSLPPYRICYWYMEKQKIMERFDLLDISIPDHWDQERHWFDLYKVFRNGPIVLKHAFSFSLKSIVHALYKLGFITLNYDDLECQDGQQSLLWYKKMTTISCPPEEKLQCQHDLEEYNRIDCLVLDQILTFLQKKIIL